MSALGQKQTHAMQQRMSALPPKPDIRERGCHIYDQISRYRWVAVEINASTSPALFPPSTQTAMLQDYVKVIRECQKF